MRRLAATLTLAVVPTMALAHGGSPGAPPGWTLEPWLLILMGLSLGLYVVGAARLSRRSGASLPVRRRSALLFGAGWLALGLAAVSPLHEAGERSFTLHMIEHEILMLVAAPLLVLARPLGAMIWAFPAGARLAMGSAGRERGVKTIWGLLCDPVVATLLQAAALWIWHVPGLFDLALTYEGWHIAQHLCFFVTALLFWEAMLPRARAHVGLSAICLFATSLVAGALGALMAFAQSPWYARYALLGMAPFGLSPIEDQQLAGLLMWVPGGLVHAGAALALIGRALAPPQAGASSAVQKAKQRRALSG